MRLLERAAAVLLGLAAAVGACSSSTRSGLDGSPIEK
jgi:hypothetical protein